MPASRHLVSNHETEGIGLVEPAAMKLYTSPADTEEKNRSAELDPILGRTENAKLG
jgi:hypothetical protein